ncbi:MAG: dihydrofolate reductase family protein [Solirubrobacteraceae bacterium]
MTDDGLRPLTDTGVGWPARKVVRALGLREQPPGRPARPRVVAAMIASADGRAAIGGRSVALGAPADRALLRELRTAVDAVLVGTPTLAAERYGNLLDDDQRAHRVASGMEPEPIVATVSRRLDVPTGIPLLSEPTARVQIYTEAPGDVPGGGAWVAVHRFEPGALTIPALLCHLQSERGVSTILCEGGPTLLRQMVAAGAVDDLLLTVSPVLAAGAAPGPLEGPALDPPAGLRLRDVRRSGDHLFLHYTL